MFKKTNLVVVSVIREVVLDLIFVYNFIFMREIIIGTLVLIIANVLQVKVILVPKVVNN